MSAALTEEERLLLQAAQDHFALNLSTLASIAWLVYDIVLTLPQEFQLVWSCRRWLWFIGLGPSISNATGELLFMTRIYAAYGRSRRMFMFLLFLWLAEGVTGWVATILNIKATGIIDRPLNYPLPGCTEDQTPSNFVHLDLLSWTVDSAVAVCLCVLILGFFIRSTDFRVSSRASGGLRLSELRKLAPVMLLFVRDGMSYFILWLIASYAIAVSPLFVYHTAAHVSPSPSQSSRLYLNLRGSVADGDSMLTYPLRSEDDLGVEFRAPTTQLSATTATRTAYVDDSTSAGIAAVDV
ncbi:hypothetical protein CERSUDRAFT_100529 [Gelatoporia subvermispora B]|uniref:DUF6533 domain-containing protein n=1 Tax=Ceriporiopsis subvermispora (strain B) TaxID=914234 RepID=M2Q3F8_CERS8|nr:hypothetical protein CERSUDRAFT_100529 [Gelatoporia subvermispora B]